MPKRSKSGNGRVSSATRHKVERKKRERKRDLRKAAKAMRASGTRVRPKKMRTMAKQALRVSNADPNKEKVLSQLLKVREKVMVSKQMKKAERRKAQKEELDELPDVSGGKAGVALKDQLDGGVQRLTNKEVYTKQRQETIAAAHAERSREQQQALKQYLLIPEGQNVGNPWIQFETCVERLREQVSTFVVTLDARCPAQSIPWSMVDAIVAEACERRVEELGMRRAVREEIEEQQRKKKTPGNSAKKAGKRARAEGEEEEEELVLPPISPSRRVIFVLTKADLVPFQALASGLVDVAEALTERYGETLLDPEALLNLDSEEDDDAPPKKTPKKQNAAAAANTKSKTDSDLPAPVVFTALPFSELAETSIKLIVQALLACRNPPLAKGQPRTSNVHGKICAAVIGLPNSGKTTFCRCLIQASGDSSASSVPCRTIRTAKPKAEERRQPDDDEELGEEEEEDEGQIVIPGAKNITLITVADDEKLKRCEVLSGGEVVFHPKTTINHIDVEAAAVLLVEQFADPIALCQRFSLPLSESPEKFLVSLGRVIVRDRGFQPGNMASGAAGRLSTSVLTGSKVRDSAKLVLAARAFQKVVPNKTDGRNPLKIGARTFLNEFYTSSVITWYAASPSLAEGEEEKTAASFAEKLAILKPFVVPVAAKKEAQKLNGGDGDEDDISALQMLAWGMRTYRALMPPVGMEVSTDAFAGRQDYTPMEQEGEDMIDDGDVEEDDEEGEEVEEEEEDEEDDDDELAAFASGNDDEEEEDDDEEEGEEEDSDIAESWDEEDSE